MRHEISNEVSQTYETVLFFDIVSILKCSLSENHVAKNNVKLYFNP